MSIAYLGYGLDVKLSSGNTLEFLGITIGLTYYISHSYYRLCTICKKLKK